MTGQQTLQARIGSEKVADERLSTFYARRHPRYDSLIGHWQFLRACYEGGREWFGENIFRYHKEGEEEFGNRLKRAYRFNHTREVVDLVQKYLFKGDIVRKETDAPAAVVEFWKNATLKNLSIEKLIKQGSTRNSIYGRVAIVVDNNLRGDDAPVSKAEAAKTNARIYAYVVTAEDILDYAWDEDGDGGLLWIKLREMFRDDTDPIESSGLIFERVRLWTRTESVLYEQHTEKVGRKDVLKTVEIDRVQHGLGIVPVVLFDHTNESTPYDAPGLIDDIAYLDRSVANYLSNLDAIIQDQTFSQLAIPASAIAPGDDIYQKVLELGTKRVFVYDPGAGSTAKPEYLSPDPKQAGVILAVIAKIINEIYHTIGLAGERTKEDNSVGIDNSSGVAKAYDFERVNALLLSKAGACEAAENEITKIVCAWANESMPEEKLVSYPKTFDVLRLIDELSTAETLGKLNAPAEVRREQMRSVVDKLFPRLTRDLREKLEADIKKWLGEEDPMISPPPTAFAGKSAVIPSRQGQVTKDTPAKEQGASASK